jgi:hypothetical protein
MSYIIVILAKSFGAPTSDPSIFFFFFFESSFIVLCGEPYGRQKHDCNYISN